MFLNGFSVRLPEGQEQPGGYVELTPGTVYTLVLHNGRQTRADAWVEVDGQHAGTFRLASHSTIRLERPAHDTGRFTFVAMGTPEADQAGLRAGDPNLGLLRVVFTPEQAPSPPLLVTDPHHPFSHHVRDLGGGPVYRTSAAHTAGGTGLSGWSSQTFVPVEHLAPDVAQQTTIHLRLVAATSAASVRPLTAFSTPVPPPV